MNIDDGCKDSVVASHQACLPCPPLIKLIQYEFFLNSTPQEEKFKSHNFPAGMDAFFTLYEG